MSKVKSMERMEEGYVQVQLQAKKEVDAYMLELIEQCPQALTCMQDKRSSTKFLYDVKERLSVSEVLALWKFQRKDAMDFLHKLFSILQVVDQKLPVVADLDMIFMDGGMESIQVLILPIHEHFNAENDWTVFLESILKRIQVVDGDAFYGWLYRFVQSQPKGVRAINQVLSQVEDIKITGILRQMLQARREAGSLLQENQARILQELNKQRLAQRCSPSEEITTQVSKAKPNDTVVLFAKKARNGYLKDEQGELYPLQSETLIGRGENCTLCLKEPAISLEHALLIQKEDTFSIQDLDSSNGTYVNGVQIDHKEVQLKEKDEILLANHRLIFTTKKAK